MAIFMSSVDSQMPEILHQMHFPPEKFPRKIAFSYSTNETANFQITMGFLDRGPIAMTKSHLRSNHLMKNRPILTALVND
jgi:hypothetical protein